MSLVTVTSPDNPEKFLLMGQSVGDLLKSAIEAFNLPASETYEIRRESDGVKIISDDVLRFLSGATEKDGNLTVVISPVTNPNLNPVTTPNLNGGVPVTSPPRIPLCPNRPNVVRPPLPMRNIVDSLNPILDIALHPELHNITPGRFLKQKKAAVKETYQEVVKFIKAKVKCYSHATAKHYAQLVLGYDGGKFSKLFEVKVGSSVKSGLGPFTLQVYNHLNYRKDDTEKRPRGARRRLELGDDDNEDDPQIPADMSSAAYGCVRYEEPLPIEETEESQEQKRLDLLSVEPDCAEAEVLMEKTYVSQRISINRAVPLKKRLPEVFRQWPLLRHRKHLCQHASRLLGKDVQTVWSSALGEKCGRFSDFMLTHWTTEDKRKSSTLSRKMLDLLQEKEAASVSLSLQSNCLAMFPLLTGFLKDQEGLLFKLVPAATSDDDVLGQINSDNPLLVIRGQSLFDVNATADLFITRICIPPDNPLDGFLLLILAYFAFPSIPDSPPLTLTHHPETKHYFVFGFKYPSKVASSLEFIQRQLLDINPERGSKRDGRNKTGMAAKVRTLTEQLTYHCSTWSVCRF
ncbi:uncharacterized protein LOC117652041 [Thrips palmi]|uniref:Uncharacterized protein LOC117652041 n=1 Tax=Thrips palmi TaxID=161013 RepID=A0A6P9A8E6_THRPL|nr:uncharacterized protein LOC117652041 [Thrips palmi]